MKTYEEWKKEQIQEDEQQYVSRTPDAAQNLLYRVGDLERRMGVIEDIVNPGIRATG